LLAVDPPLPAAAVYLERRGDQEQEGAERMIQLRVGAREIRTPEGMGVPAPDQLEPDRFIVGDRRRDRLGRSRPFPVPIASNVGEHPSLSDQEDRVALTEEQTADLLAGLKLLGLSDRPSKVFNHLERKPCHEAES